jgi:general secretion pathway protein G
MSLLEIIIVIVLIGAVLTLVASRVLGGADRGKANLAKSQIQTLAGKIDNYQLDTNKLPSKLDDLVTAPGGVSGWLGPYANASDLNDPWGHPIEYRVPGDGKPYDLISLGKDGQPGGSSYNADIKNP